MKITHFDRCAEQELRREYKIATFPQVHLKSTINTIQIFFQSYREHLCISMESSSKAKFQPGLCIGMATKFSDLL